MAETFVVAALQSTPSQLYNAPVLGLSTIEDFFIAIREHVPQARLHLDVSLTPSPETIAPFIDGALARRELGVFPRYSLTDGVGEMIERYRREAYDV